MSNPHTKHFETSERRPPLRVRSRTWDDTPNTLVTVEEKQNGSWSRLGSIELSFGPIDSRGVCAPGDTVEWAHTRFHATGDRVRVDKRLLAQEDANNSYTLRLEERREQVLGHGREEHDWKPIDEWTFDVPNPGAPA